MLIEIMADLKAKGTDQTIKTFRNQGCKSDLFGVKVGDIKVILKKIKKRQDLVLELFATLNADAQYLAGLAADPALMTKEQLLNWAAISTWHMVGEYAVAWNIAEHKDSIEICNTLIASKSEDLRAIGWSALSHYCTYDKRADLNEKCFDSYLDTVILNIATEANRVKYNMNGFVIALGGSDKLFTEKCKLAAQAIGKVDVKMGETACKVPEAIAYIEKMESMGRIGKRKKTVKC